MTAELEKAARAYRRAEQTLEQRRDELVSAIVAAASADPPMKQADIVRVTGYTRETIRRIYRDARKS